MKAELFIERLLDFLDTNTNTKLCIAIENRSSYYQYMMVGETYDDGFLRIKISNEHKMPDITVSELMTALANISPDINLTAVDIDDGTIYIISNIRDNLTSDGKICIEIKQ